MTKLYQLLLQSSGPIHFVGIGGIGMSGLARILTKMGVCVTGSDVQDNKILEGLRDLDIPISIGHSKGHLEGCSVVVISSAIPESNPEYLEAIRRGIPVLHRADVLAELMRVRTGIAISGTHGKTTTSAMIVHVLLTSGIEATFVVGAVIPSLRSNAKYGPASLMVCEADESDRSFLKIPALCKVVTNIDLDHMDEYRDGADLEDTFHAFLESTPVSGQIIACKDDSRLERVIKKVHRPVVSYGLDRSADVSAVLTGKGGFRSQYDCYHHGRSIGSVDLGVPGCHNVLNSLAAVAVGLWLKLPFQAISDGLSSFRGAERRQQWKGEKGGVTVIDDYAHHPVEIRATLDALRSESKRIIAVYQPHRFSRTQFFLDRMDDCFDGVDRLFVMPIYSAGEEPIPGVTSRELVDRIGRHKRVSLVEGTEEAVDTLRRLSQPGDLVVTLGAGDIWKVGEAFLAEDTHKEP
jgi:UDP-N-acetylmuramate--alanine ligase